MFHLIHRDLCTSYCGTNRSSKGALHTQLALSKLGHFETNPPRLAVNEENRCISQSFILIVASVLSVWLRHLNVFSLAP